MQKKHPEEPEVAAAEILSKPEKDRAYEGLKKKGIYRSNQQAMRNNKEEYMRERNSKAAETDTVMCGYCRGFYASHYFHRHKQRCMAAEAGGVAVSVPLPVVQGNEMDNDPDFAADILGRFHPDDVGKFCQVDEVVLALGKSMYLRKKPVARINKSKGQEVRKSVMKEMRQLGSVLIEFKAQAKEDNLDLTSFDLLNRKHMKYLAAAVIKLSTNSESEEDIKAGTKLAIGNVIKETAKVMKVFYLEKEEDEKGKEVDNFVTVFNLKWPSLFADAQYKVLMERQKRLRKPARLPEEEEIKKLKEYMVPEMERITSETYALWTPSEFKELRNVTVCRLTLFNCRRGGEPSRLLIDEWKDAEEDKWLPQHSLANLPVAEQQLIKKYKIAYQAGKGQQRLVSVIIPADCLPAMRLLASEEVRSHAGVAPGNKFVFANTQLSLDHVGGWAATKEMCTKAGLSHKVTATDMRHRVSTYYANLEVSDKEMDLMFSHLGHCGKTNVDVYQCPLAAATITKVGRHLEHLDCHGKTTLSVSIGIIAHDVQVTLVSAAKCILGTTGNV